MNNKELLEYVKKEDIDEKELSKIWNTSRSVKVRKEIAKNPNASVEVLEQSARLYLEEVIENPAFEMLALFDSDEWVNTVAKAYRSPGEAIYSSMKWIRQSVSHDTIFRAALLSDQLDLDCLDIIATGISSAALKRAFKNKRTQERVKNLVITSQFSITSQIGKLSMESVLRLYREGLFDRAELIQVINLHISMSSSCSKALYKKVFYKEIEDYQSTSSALQKETIGVLLGSLIAKSRAHCFSWVSREICYWGNVNLNDDLISLFCDILQFLENSAKKSKVLDSVLKDNIHSIKNVIVSFFRMDYSAYNLKSREEKVKLIKKIYQFCNCYNIKNLTMARYGIKFTSDAWMAAFEECSEKEQTFFVKEGCLGSWFTVNFSDKKFRIIDQLNENAYKSHGVSKELIYSYCSIKKIVSLPDTHIF